MTGQRIQQEAICYQWFKQRLILSVSEPSISQRSQIKEDTVEPSVPAREFNLKAYAAITWHNDPASLGLEPRLANHRSQPACTATLSTVPPRQAIINVILWYYIIVNIIIINLIVFTKNTQTVQTSTMEGYTDTQYWNQAHQLL